MLYTIALIVSLISLAGVIAYAGDVLGTMVGRRRLSLFGWRPKRTGQVVGIAVGILIMFSTLLVLSLAFREATSVVLNAQQAAQELATLRQQRVVLEQELQEAQAARDAAGAARDNALREASELRQVQVELQAQLTGLRAQVDGLQRQASNLELESSNLTAINRELESSNRSLRIVNEALNTENSSLQQSLSELGGRVDRLQSQMDTLRQELASRAEQLVATREQLQLAQHSEPIYGRGEVMHRGIIHAPQSQDALAVREMLSEFVSELNRQALERGAGSVSLDVNQVDRLVSAVLASDDEAVVLFISPYEQFAGSRLEVILESYANYQLAAAGQLISSRQLYLGRGSLDDVRAELGRLSSDALRFLQSQGWRSEGRSVVSADVLESFMPQLARLQGPVTVGLVSAEALYVSDNVQLEPIIIHQGDTLLEVMPLE